MPGIYTQLGHLIKYARALDREDYASVQDFIAGKRKYKAFKASLMAGAARLNPEGRSSTIYLGGFASRLGIPGQAAGAAPGGEGGLGLDAPRSGRPGRIPASAFLGLYYGGGGFPNASSRFYRGQIP